MNPHLRPTAAELLKHKIFDKVRVMMNEDIEPSNKYKIKLDFNEYRYDYENEKNL